MRRRVLVVLAAVAMSLAITQAAWAVGGSLTSHFNHATETFHGKVRSTEAECRINRVVKVYLVTANGRELQGTNRTNDSGRWSLHLMEAHGSYVAIAPAFEAMHATCDRLASDPVDVM
jgi:hypothetical protein